MHAQAFRPRSGCTQLLSTDTSEPGADEIGGRQSLDVLIPLAVPSPEIVPPRDDGLSQQQLVHAKPMFI
jgi:hypothetical protein